MYSELASDHDRTIQLVNYGGKLVIIWYEWYELGRVTEGAWSRFRNKRIWCTVVRLEKIFGKF